MNAVIIILISIGAVILTAAIAFCGIYFNRLRTVGTLKRITAYEDGYNLYSMTVRYDYSAQDVLNAGFTDTAGFTNAVVKEALPLLPVKIEIPSFGCSAFRAQSDGGETVMGRNYDFRLNTSCLAVLCHPKGGYSSVAFCALDNIRADKAEQSLKTRFACLTAPFVCLDGVNEKGVSIAILTLDSAPTDQQTGKVKNTGSILVRMVLDSCASTQEAVDLFAQYDMMAANGRDYHYFISDASGDSRVVEYDPEDPARPLIVTEMPAITNFYGRYIDRVLPNQKNGVYGHGKERYDAMMEIITAKNGILCGEDAWAPLKAAATEPNPASVTSNTQWSIVFNNTKGTADIILRRHWGDKFSFTCR